MTKATKETDIDTLRMESRRNNDAVNSLKVEIGKLKKKFKKLENERNKIKNSTYEARMRIDKINKEKEDVNGQNIKVSNTVKGMICEQKLLLDKEETLRKEDDKAKKEVNSLEKNINEQEQKLKSLKDTESDAMKTIKNLTTLRETMARRASGAMAEVRETREELKIKELLMLDLTKKQQEIEYKLNDYKVIIYYQTLYEEVKSARNRFVNEIQNSSQQLAELKQRIKISQNELEILKNESTEKEKSFLKLVASTKQQIHERDKKLAQLNKSEFEKQKLTEQGNQQASEIEKLDMITRSLQGDMLEIRKHYESACESRNYMGVQLIERNDELYNILIQVHSLRED